VARSFRFLSTYSWLKGVIVAPPEPVQLDGTLARNLRFLWTYYWLKGVVRDRRVELSEQIACAAVVVWQRMQSEQMVVVWQHMQRGNMQRGNNVLYAMHVVRRLGATELVVACVVEVGGERVVALKAELKHVRVAGDHKVNRKDMRPDLLFTCHNPSRFFGKKASSRNQASNAVP